MNSKRAVVRYMEAHARDKDTAAWLSREYGGDENKGLFIVRAGSPEETELSWPKVQRRIAQLIKAEKFFTSEEYDRFENIDPVVIRERLAERSIVNGEVVDEEKHNNSLFIQQVMADVDRVFAEENLIPGETIAMSKIFGGIFGRVERSIPGTSPTIVIDGEAYDIGYVKYCIEKDRAVTALETKLHESDDPRLIAEEALKTACQFYGGDWAGILDVDLDLDIWTPLWWYNAASQGKTTSLFGEFQLARSMPNWIEALKSGSSICLTDMSTVQREHPEEYEIYKRLKVDSVIGVPFGPNPVGILAIRNPTRHTQYDSALNVFAYVIHRAMAQQKTIDSSRLALAPEEIKTDKDIIVNFFGSMSICTAKGVLTEREFNAPKCSRVVTYLLLNQKSTFHPLPIVSALWPEEEDKWETSASYVRNYIHKFKKAFDLVSPYPLIVHSGTGYGINPDLNIMTDLNQFDLLLEEAQHTTIIPHKVELMKKAISLYKGTVFENADGEMWIKPIATKYRLQYIGIVNELLATLDEAGEFTGLRQHAARAVELTPENIRAHYWLLHAMNHLGTLELARNHIAHAKEILTSDEYASLKKSVAQDSTMPFAVLFSDG